MPFEGSKIGKSASDSGFMHVDATWGTPDLHKIGHGRGQSISRADPDSLNVVAFTA